MAVEGERPRRPSPAMRLGAWILLTIAIAACGALQPLEIRKIALLVVWQCIDAVRHVTGRTVYATVSSRAGCETSCRSEVLQPRGLLAL